jgi:hypothetical protein
VADRDVTTASRSAHLWFDRAGEAEPDAPRTGSDTEVDGPRALHDDVRLSNALRDKARKRHETSGMPFVVAVVCAGAFITGQDVAVALWGPKGPVAGRPGVVHLRRDRHPGTRSPVSVAALEPTLWLNRRLRIPSRRTVPVARN